MGFEGANCHGCGNPELEGVLDAPCCTRHEPYSYRIMGPKGWVRDKWTAGGEQAKGRVFHHFNNQYTCFPAEHQPCLPCPKLFFTRLSVLSLFISGWLRRCCPHQNLLGQQSPSESRVSCPYQVVPFVFLLHSQGALGTHRMHLKHDLWMLQMRHDTSLFTLLIFVSIRKIHERFNSFFKRT